jgi:hypothetical protein
MQTAVCSSGQKGGEPRMRAAHSGLSGRPDGSATLSFLSSSAPPRKTSPPGHRFRRISSGARALCAAMPAARFTPLPFGPRARRHAPPGSSPAAPRGRLSRRRRRRPRRGRRPGGRAAPRSRPPRGIAGGASHARASEAFSAHHSGSRAGACMGLEFKGAFGAPGFGSPFGSAAFFDATPRAPRTSSRRIRVRACGHRRPSAAASGGRPRR